MSRISASPEPCLVNSAFAPEPSGPLATANGLAPSLRDRQLEGLADRCCRHLILRRLQRLQLDGVEIRQGEKRWRIGEAQSLPAQGIVEVHRPRFYRRLATGGSLAAAESFIQGDWDSPDLPGLLARLARSSAAMSGVNGTAGRLMRPLLALRNWFRRNTRTGSRRNISAHYDLSNEFFALMLDRTMTYSSGMFTHPQLTLEEAQVAKYESIARKLRLRPGLRLLEIGSGWGGFAQYAASRHGCHVTTTTISRQQYEYARDRIRRAGLESSVTLLQQDYRDLRGQFDRLVSIEMIEAVGAGYLGQYFAQCTRLLKPEGLMCLQAITIPDHRYASYRRSVDFIQRYIFPGGHLPSLAAIGRALARYTDLRLVQAEDFGAHYARTLQLWRENFWQSLDRVRQMGFDDRFIRTWDYYLCYCLAGFAERQIGVSQFVLARPQASCEPQWAAADMGQQTH